MKFIILVIVILVIFIFGFYLGKGNSWNNNVNIVYQDTHSGSWKMSDNSDNKKSVIDNQNTGSTSIKSNFPSIYAYNSFEDVYSEFKTKIPVIEDILAQWNAESIYWNGWMDVFIEPAYLCYIIDTSFNEEKLKWKMKSASWLLLISWDDTFGGKENIQNYNSIIEQYYNTNDNYSVFYNNYLKNFTILMDSDLLDSDVKTLGRVIWGIYSLWKDKFVDWKSIDCYEYLKKNFPNIRSNK